MKKENHTKPVNLLREVFGKVRALFLKGVLTLLMIAYALIILFSIVCTKALYESSPIYSEEVFDRDFISWNKCINCTSGFKETDDIINFFSGRKDLPENTKFNILLIDSMKILERKIPQNHGDSKERLIEQYKYLKTISIDEFKQSLMNEGFDIKKRFHFVSDSIDRDLLYYAVWSIYDLYGSPKIRYEPSDKVFLYNFGIDAFYNPLKNEFTLKDLYVNENGMYYFSLDNFFGEIAHVRQFQISPCRSIVLATRGIVRSFFRSIQMNITFYYKDLLYFKGVNSSKRSILYNDKSIVASYQYEYYRKDAFEYEAHVTIENSIRKRYETLINFYIEENF